MSIDEVVLLFAGVFGGGIDPWQLTERGVVLAGRMRKQVVRMFNPFAMPDEEAQAEDQTPISPKTLSRLEQLKRLDDAGQL